MYDWTYCDYVHIDQAWIKRTNFQIKYAHPCTAEAKWAQREEG